MSCGTPCVVTDVGDAKFIVGKNGWIVPPNNSIKLAKAIEKALSEICTSHWSTRCNKARLRIKDNFNIINMIKSYSNLWNNVNKLS